MAKVVSTKGNLIALKKSLALAQNGYDLLDKKRNVLISELMSLQDKVKLLRNELDDAYRLGYFYLQRANISGGLISNIAKEIPLDNSISITYRSIMGVEVPMVSISNEPIELTYGIENTTSSFDEAYVQFNKIKLLTVTLAEIDNSVYKLANAIRTTQKRANALKNVVIPNFETNIKRISEELEEKEREEFTRLKVIKANKLKVENE